MNDPANFSEVNTSYNSIIDSVEYNNYWRPDNKIEYNNILFSPEVNVLSGDVDVNLSITDSIQNSRCGASDINKTKKHIVSGGDWHPKNRTDPYSKCISKNL